MDSKGKKQAGRHKNPFTIATGNRIDNHLLNTWHIPFKTIVNSLRSPATHFRIVWTIRYASAKKYPNIIIAIILIR